MATSKTKLFTTRNVTFLLAASAFPIYSWAIFRFLERMPGWLYYLTTWELVGIFAYTQLFALLESLLVGFVLLLAAALLSAFLKPEQAIAFCSLAALLTALGVIAFQYGEEVLRASSPLVLAAVGGAYLLLLGLFGFLIYRHTRWQTGILSLIERLSVLLYIYLPVSLLSGAIVVVRNL